ncbi:MAG: hypothetical protein L0338_28445 [Acidobacteria bacterium]|nr:hypothetical protein [Acidobacteriota bacterium]
MLSTHIPAFRDLYTKFLAIRMAWVIDEVTNRFPSECTELDIPDNWKLFSSLRGHNLVRALQEPALEFWVSDMSALLATSGNRLRPETHVPRALARFSALMMNYVELFQDCPVSGRVTVIGSRALPLFLSKAVLRRTTPRRTLLRWAYRQGRLSIRDEAGAEMVLGIDESCYVETMRHMEWALETSQPLGSVQVFSHALCIDHDSNTNPCEFYSGVLYAYDQLPLHLQETIQNLVRVVAPSCTTHLHNGLGHIGLSTPCPETLAQTLAEELVGRISQLYRFRTGASVIADLGVCCQEELIERIEAELRPQDTSFPLSSFLEQLIIACVRGSRIETGSPDMNRVERLDFTQLVTKAKVADPVGTRWSEAKCRLENSRQVVGWQIIDELTSLTKEKRISLQTALNHEENVELAQYGLACVDYIAGRFRSATHHLLRCLAADPRCENYWALLAFCCRYLGRLDLFEDIVFDLNRDLGLCSRISSVLATHE